MVANPVLVDSSWYIRLARMRRNPLVELALIASQRDVATCGIVRCEVARGLRAEGHLRAFQRAWDLMVYVPTDNRLWADVERSLWDLDRRGITLPLPDVLIACCARRISAVILTFDERFRQIPGIRAVSEIV